MPISATQLKQLKHTVGIFLLQTKYSNLQQLNNDAGNHIRSILFPDQYQQALSQFETVVNHHSNRLEQIVHIPLPKTNVPKQCHFVISDTLFPLQTTVISPFNLSQLCCEPFVDVLGVSQHKLPIEWYTQLKPVSAYIDVCVKFHQDCQWWNNFFDSIAGMSMGVFRKKYPNFHKAVDLYKHFNLQGAVDSLSEQFLMYVRNTADNSYFQQVS